MKLEANLLAKLEDTLHIIDKLINICDIKQKALKENNLELLNQTIQAENLLLKEFERSEKKLLFSQKEIAEELNINEYSLDIIKGKIELNIAKKLGDLQAILIQKILNLKEINQLNNMLLKQNVAYVQSLIQTISQIQNQGNNQVYSQSGQVKKEESSSLLNQRV